MSTLTGAGLKERAHRWLAEKRPDLQIQKVTIHHIGTHTRVARVTLIDQRFAQLQLAGKGSHYGRLGALFAAELARIFPKRQAP